MLKKDKVTFIINKLDELYPSVNPPLNHSNNFTLLIAVLLSANSTDKSVNNVTPTLFKIADSPRKILKLTYEDLYQMIKPCGLGPAKASNILKLSKILDKNHNGNVPDNFEDVITQGHLFHQELTFSLQTIKCQVFGLNHIIFTHDGR